MIQPLFFSKFDKMSPPSLSNREKILPKIQADRIRSTNENFLRQTLGVTIPDVDIVKDKVLLHGSTSRYSPQSKIEHSNSTTGWIGLFTVILFTSIVLN